MICSQPHTWFLSNYLSLNKGTIIYLVIHLILQKSASEELKNLLVKVKEESAKAGLKLNIQKTKIMAFGPITSWQIDRETMEIVRDFIFLGSKIIADGDCSHGIKRHLLLGKRAMTNLDSILKAETLLCQQRSVQSKLWFFPVVMYTCKSWTKKKAQCQ